MSDNTEKQIVSEKKSRQFAENFFPDFNAPLCDKTLNTKKNVMASVGTTKFARNFFPDIKQI